MEALFERARTLCDSAPQVIVTETWDGRTLVLLHDPVESHAREDAFLDTLRENGGRVRKLVCMWQGGCLDVPSMYLRKGLMELTPENAACQVLLQGAQGLNVKKLQRLF